MVEDLRSVEWDDNFKILTFRERRVEVNDNLKYLKFSIISDRLKDW